MAANSDGDTEIPSRSSTIMIGVRIFAIQLLAGLVLAVPYFLVKSISSFNPFLGIVLSLLLLLLVLYVQGMIANTLYGWN